MEFRRQNLDDDDVFTTTVRSHRGGDVQEESASDSSEKRNYVPPGNERHEYYRLSTYAASPLTRADLKKLQVGRLAETGISYQGRMLECFKFVKMCNLYTVYNLLSKFMCGKSLQIDDTVCDWRKDEVHLPGCPMIVGEETGNIPHVNFLREELRAVRGAGKGAREKEQVIQSENNVNANILSTLPPVNEERTVNASRSNASSRLRNTLTLNFSNHNEQRDFVAEVLKSPDVPMSPHFRSPRRRSRVLSSSSVEDEEATAQAFPRSS